MISSVKFSVFGFGKSLSFDWVVEIFDFWIRTWIWRECPSILLVHFNSLNELQFWKFQKTQNFRKLSNSFKIEKRWNKSSVWVINYESLWPTIKCRFSKCMVLGICWRVIFHQVMQKYNLKYLSAIQNSFFSPINPSAIEIRGFE